MAVQATSATSRTVLATSMAPWPPMAFSEFWGFFFFFGGDCLSISWGFGGEGTLKEAGPYFWIPFPFSILNYIRWLIILLIKHYKMNFVCTVMSRDYGVGADRVLHRSLTKFEIQPF